MSRVIPRLFGVPLGRLLRQRQIDEAKRLLRVTTLRIDEVASASAFGDRTTLFRVFKAVVGLTPNQYRNQFDARQKVTKRHSDSGTP